jgi:putative sterol carrier protein
MIFGSMKYLEEVKRRSNADEEYQRLAQDESDSYLMVIKAEADRGIPETLTIGYGADHGTINDVWIGEREADFVLQGPYGVWVRILTGDLDANKAMMMRKLKVKGNLLQLLKTADATIRWLEVLQTIPTEFEGDYAKRSFPGEKCGNVEV